ncbi:Alpha/Beta hydrolase protein [Dendryphion nanum]|uniref:Alpha/Beta hydrolase protein n=1 Tax=Dendryphion nanum TaxID=256645 RepID=A0A9P9E4Z6_9PLEO|nr:Alpha/Beta hydrolase protein [Dendryphion nanum]
MSFLRKVWRPKTSGDKALVGTDAGSKSSLYTTDGPTGIRVIADPPDATIDIVFVHGLTGSREKTWTHSNSVFWPGALLPEDIPRARIMTFGYDADVVRFWSIASSNRLDDHGKSLAYAVLDQRDDDVVGKRPIIFIAHSLGGLVCEEALNLSSKRPALQSILPNTLGIIFMGTPHGGSHVANWGTTVAKYVNVFRGTNRDILQNLQPGSSDLLRTEQDFQQMLRRDNVKLKIYCFYEALKMSDVVGKIVEQESAVLPAYDNCSIHADHRDMTKFTGRADPGYGSVRGVLQRWIREGRDEIVKAGAEEGSGKEGEGNDEGGKGKGKGKEMVNTGAVFHGNISGRNVIAGSQNNGGTTNYHFG